jgi:hypothetical protein
LAPAVGRVDRLRAADLGAAGWFYRICDKKKAAISDSLFTKEESS